MKTVTIDGVEYELVQDRPWHSAKLNDKQSIEGRLLCVQPMPKPEKTLIQEVRGHLYGEKLTAVELMILDIIEDRLKKLEQK